MKLKITTTGLFTTHHALLTQKLKQPLTIPKSMKLTINKPAWHIRGQGLHQKVSRKNQPGHVRGEDPRNQDGVVDSEVSHCKLAKTHTMMMRCALCWARI